MLQTRDHLAAIREEQDRVCAAIDSQFDELLAVPDDRSAPLYEAMRYAAIGGGKRLRPLLVAASAQLLDVSPERALRAGLAVECIHAQSLIHDDLPCMDDDDLRRGKPSVHCAFGQATAVLAGDSLLALAFEILGDRATHPDPDVRIQLVRTLTKASGAAGMAGGQMIDLLAPTADFGLEDVEHLQRRKTGALISWSVAASGIMGYASTEVQKKLDRYSRCLGLAFQITDDLLDVEGDEAVIGKRVRKDCDAGKETFVSLLGVDAAHARAQTLADEAVEHLRPFGTEADLLRSIAGFAVNRDR